MTERRRFIVTAGGAMATVAVATIVDAPNVIAQPKVQWHVDGLAPARTSRARPSSCRRL